MNVLVNCLSSVSGGAVSYLRNMASLLMKEFENSLEGHKLTFLAHASQKALITSIPDAQCIWIGGAQLTGWRRALWERKIVARTVENRDFDVLFTPYQIGPRMHGVRQVLMLRNMEPFLFREYSYGWRTRLRNYLLRWQSLLQLRRANRVIAVSEFAESFLKDELGIPPERTLRIYHGKDSSLHRAGNLENDWNILKPLGIEGSFLLTCGSLLPYRRCEDVIAAFNCCAEALDPKTQLVIAGSGTDKRYGELIRKTIAASPYADRILLVGHVPFRTMAALYRNCAVCVIATEIEACPNIAIEAMATGCIIVSSNRSPLPEMFKGCSLEYRARDIEHLASQIRAAVGDCALGRNLKAHSLKRAEDFSWDKCARETYSALVEW